MTLEIPLRPGMGIEMSFIVTDPPSRSVLGSSPGCGVASTDMGTSTWPALALPETAQGWSDAAPSASKMSTSPLKRFTIARAAPCMRKLDACNFSNDISMRNRTVDRAICRPPPVTGALTSSDVGKSWVWSVMGLPGSMVHVPVADVMAASLPRQPRTRARSGS